MTWQEPDGAPIRTLVQEMRNEAVPEHMRLNVYFLMTARWSASFKRPSGKSQPTL